jgi:putative SOS response-associated peptidase YedK
VEFGRDFAGYALERSREEDWSPRYNIAPTQSVLVIRENPKEPVRELSLLRSGRIPSWARDSSAAAKMINARSETASAKPAFRDALRFRKHLIPADAFYQWVRTGKRSSRTVLKSMTAYGKTLETCSILTRLQMPWPRPSTTACPSFL